MRETVWNEKQAEGESWAMSPYLHIPEETVCVCGEGLGGNTDCLVYSDWLNPKVSVLGLVIVLSALARSLFPQT